jgi:predicted TIM-barrel fold metal-dependent hydrolase
MALAMGEMPLGRGPYWPIYEAAARHGFALGIHAGSTYRHALTQSGFPSFLAEDHIHQAQGFANQVGSLVAEGVFAKFPELKVVLIESGITWLPGLMWRMSKDWRGARIEVPWVKEMPAKIIRNHFRMTTQPFDGPARPEEAAKAIAHLNSEEMLLFSTDFPHDHGRDVSHWPENLPAGPCRRLVRDNVREPINAWRSAHERDDPRTRTPGHAEDRHRGLRHPSRLFLARRAARAICRRAGASMRATSASARQRLPGCHALSAHHARQRHAARFLAAQWRAAGIRPRLPAGAAARPAGHRVRHPAAAGGRAARRFNQELGAALCTALNDWQIDKWLDKEPRLRARSASPRRTRASLHRRDRGAGRRQALRPDRDAAANPGAGRAQALLAALRGRAAHHGLPIGMHSAAFGSRPTPAGGWTSFYIEEHFAFSNSLPDRADEHDLRRRVRAFPKLKLVLVEGGFAWLPPLDVAHGPRMGAHARRGSACEAAPSEYMKRMSG